MTTESTWVAYVVQKRLAVMGTQFNSCPFCGSSVFGFTAILGDDYISDIEIVEISDHEISADCLDEKTAAIVIRGMAENGELESYEDLPDIYIIKSPCGCFMRAPSIPKLVEKWNKRGKVAE